MASFSEDVDGVLRIPAVSPSRRDYSLRSSSVKASESNSSRPQSPWRPRDPHLPSPESSSFHLYESNLPGLDRSVYYSGPLPAPSKSVDRSYYSGPLPGPLPSHIPASSCFSGPLSNPSPLPPYFSGPLSSLSPLPSYFSSPLPGFSTTTIESFGFPTGSSNFPQRLLSGDALSEAPEVGSSPGSSFGEGREVALVAEDDDDDTESVGDEPYKSYGNFALSTSSISARTGAQDGNGRTRNCVSQELKISRDASYQKIHLNRGYKSGEIFGHGVRSGGTYNSSSELANPDRELKPAKVMDVRKHRPSGSIAWEALNDDANESINCQMAMVAIPFKWEEAPGKARDTVRNGPLLASPRSRSSEKKLKDSHSGVANEFSFGVSNRFYGDSANKAPEKVDSGRWSEELSASGIDLVAPTSSKFLESVPRSLKPTPRKAPRSSVPFEWEEEPGKSKFEEKAASDAIPKLQLPPRLASASVKRNSVSTSTTSSSSRRSRSMSITSEKRARARPAKGGVSASESRESSVSKHSRQSQEESQSLQQSPLAQPSTPQDMNNRLALASNFLSGPLDVTARPSQSSCGNSFASRSGPITPFGLPQLQSAEVFCETSVRSPTSTLDGPGSVPSYSSSKSSRKSSSVTYSHSSSGTSAESFEHWTYGDQASFPSTSRLPSTEFDSQGSSRSGSVKPRDDVETPNIGDKLSRRSKSSSSSSSSSKPPMNPIRSSQTVSTAMSSRLVDIEGHLPHADECSRSSPTPALKVEDELSCTQKEELIDLEPPTRLPYKMPSLSRSSDAVFKSPSSSPTRTPSEALTCLPRFFSKSEPRSNVTPCFWVENPSFHAPVNFTEDGYRSPAYKATLELLSPSPNLSKKSDSRVARLRKSSSRLGQVHIVGSLRNSLKHLFHTCT